MLVLCANVVHVQRSGQPSANGSFKAIAKQIFWRNVQKQAEEKSVFSLVMHKATILYGTASIAYVYTDSDADPHRQEISMASHEHVAEFPRLDAVDPVGLRYTIHCFRSEPPPT